MKKKSLKGRYIKGFYLKAIGEIGPQSAITIVVWLVDANLIGVHQAAIYPSRDVKSESQSDTFEIDPAVLLIRIGVRKWVIIGGGGEVIKYRKLENFTPGPVHKCGSAGEPEGGVQDIFELEKKGPVKKALGIRKSADIFRSANGIKLLIGKQVI